MTRTPVLFRTIALLLALPLAARAQSDGDRIDTTFTLDRGGIVDLGAVSGEIRVQGTDRRDIKVSASIERGRFEVSASNLRYSLRTRSSNGRQGTARIDVLVPHGTRVQASTVSGDIEIVATRGEVVARSTSGGIDVRDANERIELETVSGDVELLRVNGRIRVQGVSSTVYVDDASGELDAETVSGEIAIRRSKLTAMSLGAVSGDLSYDGTLSATGRYRLNTHSGDVTLTMPSSIGARLEVETFSGRVSSDFPLTMQPGETGGRRGRRMEFNLGDGSARIVVSSFSGNINLRRTGATTSRE